MNRLSQRALNRPASYKARLNCTVANAKLFHPLNETTRLSVVCDHTVSPRVACLLSTCCPPAVGFFVVPIIVVSLKCVLRRGTWPHVSKERFEVLPLIANAYAPLSVIDVARVSLVLAAGAHVHPDIVLRSATHSMDGEATGCGFRIPAPARNGVARPQCAARSSEPRTAFAKAVPVKRAAMGHHASSGKPQNGKSPVGLLLKWNKPVASGKGSGNDRGRIGMFDRHIGFSEGHNLQGSGLCAFILHPTHSLSRTLNTRAL